MIYNPRPRVSTTPIEFVELEFRQSWKYRLWDSVYKTWYRVVLWWIKLKSRRKANCLIVVCGYEGIEHIVGLFTEKQAIAEMTKLRECPEDKWTEPEQYCVQRVSEFGAECICEELGVGQDSGESWYY